MIVVIGADHGGYPLKEDLSSLIGDLNHKVLGIDTWFYEDQFTDSFSNSKLTQIKKDIKNDKVMPINNGFLR